MTTEDKRSLTPDQPNERGVIVPSLLGKISEPAQLKKLSYEELRQLAGEIREELISVVTQTGGHLAPSLGVVELTMSLHRVFNSPVDKIIWDVGHQAYVHKLVTGRLDRFHMIRQYGGISGYPQRDESVHDHYGTSHASTAVSAALGMAAARDIQGQNHNVVAIVGDGALTGGLAYEGLNNAGHLNKKLVVILNDNEMSIARNVGAMSRYLNRMRTSKPYIEGKVEVEHILHHIPSGERMLEMAKRVKRGVRDLVMPTTIWEELGFTYIGPIDGHDSEALDQALSRARDMQHPVFVHVLTTKGKGYAPAEADATKYHGVSSPARKSAAMTYSAAFGESMCRLAAEDPRVVGITAAMPDGTGLVKFAKQFPDRFFDVGIAEAHAVNFAAGIACENLRPVVAIYSSFMQRAYDQIIIDVCAQNLPVTLALDRAGLVAEDGRLQQGIFDLTYLRCVPNMIVMAPRDEWELACMLKTCIDHGAPAALRYPRGSGSGRGLPEKIEALPVGKAEVLREGTDVAVIAIGTLVDHAMTAAERLEAEDGLSVKVINARFAKPLDEEMFLQVARTIPRVVTLEDNVFAGGFGSAILELFAREQVTNVRVKRLAVRDVFPETGGIEILQSLFAVDVEAVVNAVRHSFADLPKRAEPAHQQTV